MPSTFPKPEASDPVRSLDNIRPRAAKAGLPSDQIGPTLGSAMCEAVIAHFGSVKAAAISLNVDPSLMQRELKACDLRRVHHLHDVALNAAIAQAWVNAFGSMMTPKQYAARLIDRVQEELNEIRQFIQEVA